MAAGIDAIVRVDEQDDRDHVLDVSVRLWALDVQSLLRWARRLVGRNLTQQEWLQHMGSLDYRATLPELPVPA